MIADTLGRDDKDGKRCSLCHFRKPRAEFSTNPSHWDGLSNWCRKCVLDYRQNPKRGYWISRERGWRQQNIVEKDDMPLRAQTFKLVLEYQNSCCALCNRGQLWGSLHADHDHATGLFRGALCYDCNRSLGVFEKLKHYGGALKESLMQDYLDHPPYERYLAYVEKLGATLRKPESDFVASDKSDKGLKYLIKGSNI